MIFIEHFELLKEVGITGLCISEKNTDMVYCICGHENGHMETCSACGTLNENILKVKHFPSRLKIKMDYHDIDVKGNKLTININEYAIFKRKNNTYYIDTDKYPIVDTNRNEFFEELPRWYKKNYISYAERYDEDYDSDERLFNVDVLLRKVIKENFHMFSGYEFEVFNEVLKKDLINSILIIQARYCKFRNACRLLDEYDKNPELVQMAITPYKTYYETRKDNVFSSVDNYLNSFLHSEFLKKLFIKKPFNNGSLNNTGRFHANCKEAFSKQEYFKLFSEDVLNIIEYLFDSGILSFHGVLQLGYCVNLSSDVISSFLRKYATTYRDETAGKMVEIRKFLESRMIPIDVKTFDAKYVSNFKNVLCLKELARRDKEDVDCFVNLLSVDALQAHEELAKIPRKREKC